MGIATKTPLNSHARLVTIQFIISILFLLSQLPELHRYLD